MDREQQISDGKVRLLTIKEAAEYLGLAVGTLYNLISEKRIEVVRPPFFSRGVRFDKRYLDKIIEEGTEKVFTGIY